MQRNRFGKQTRVKSARHKTAVAAMASIVLSCVGATASADQLFDLHAARAFSEGSASGGFMPVENISAQCLWNVMFVDLSNMGGRAQFALLMQAKAQNLRLQRVDYVRSAGGTCAVVGLHVE